MDKIDVKTLEQIEAYNGPHAISGIRFRHARQQLGVTAWGMNVLELDPHCSGYPEHDHREDGQEEVYVVLQGSLYIVIEGREVPLPSGSFVRVAPEQKRKLLTRESGATVLALGGTPGKPYEVRAF